MPRATGNTAWVCPFVKAGSSVVFDPNTFTSPNYNNLRVDGVQRRCADQHQQLGQHVERTSGPPDVRRAGKRDAALGSSFPVAGNQPMVIVFAAGNAGSAAGTVGEPSTAKNVITVGRRERAGVRRLRRLRRPIPRPTARSTSRPSPAAGRAPDGRRAGHRRPRHAIRLGRRSADRFPGVTGTATRATSGRAFAAGGEHLLPRRSAVFTRLLRGRATRPGRRRCVRGSFASSS